MADSQYGYLEGEPDLLERKAQRYVEIADAIARSTGALRAVSDEIGSKSLAMDETREKADQVRESIDNAENRYRETGSALLAYVTSLRDAKSRAQRAADQIVQAQGELDDARFAKHLADEHEQDLPTTAAPQEAQQARVRASLAQQRLADARNDLTFWQRQWQDAKDDKDRAARAASDRIKEVVTGKHTDGLKDGIWDKVGKVWDSFYQWAKVVCDVAGVLAIFLSWVPVVGQALLILAAAGAILAVVDAAMKWKRGNGGFLGFLGAAGLAALALFGGRAISAVAKYAKARMIVQASNRMGGQAARAAFGRTAIKSARRVFAQSTGQRVTEVLKSPFVRSSTDKAIWGMTRSGNTQHALKTFFPNPFKNSVERSLFGNGDVVDMFAIMGTNGVHVDNVSSITSSVAAVGAYAYRSYKVVPDLVDTSRELSNGDWGDAIKPALGLAGTPLDGPYMDVVGIVLQGVEGTPFHGLDVQNPTDHAVAVK